MSDQLKSNPELDAAFEGALTVSDLRETMLQTLSKQGTVVRASDSEFNNRLVIRQPQTPDAPLPANGFKFEREIRFYPDSGKRTLIIRANTQADLDAVEAQIWHY